MPKESLGDKLKETVGDAVENVKGGLKDLGGRPETNPEHAGQYRLPAPDGPASTGRASGMTKAELYEDAKRLDIKGRSKMTKEQLEKAIGGR
jgi:hypothetical protein